MAALATLRTINDEKTQQQVWSRLRVGKAADNAAYWSIATTMRSDKKAMGAVSDSIGFAKAVLDTTYDGMDKIKDELVTIRNLMITRPKPSAPALRLFTASMVLAVQEKEECLILQGYEALAGRAPIANDIARERLVVRCLETQRRDRPVTTMEMIQKEEKFAALEPLLLQQKGGGWCLAVIDIHLLLPIPAQERTSTT